MHPALVPTKVVSRHCLQMASLMQLKTCHMTVPITFTKGSCTSSLNIKEIQMNSPVSEYLSVCANASDSNVTRDLWSVEDKTSGFVAAVFVLLFLVIGLPWNLLVLVAIVKERLYTQPTVILLLSLLLTDIISLLLTHPLFIVTGFQGEYIIGNSDQVRCSTCKLGVIFLHFVLNTIFTICLMSLDRFLFIYKPLHYDRYVTKWRTVVALAVTWIIAAALSFISLTEFGEFAFTGLYIGCGPNSSHYQILVIAVSVIAHIPVIICNLWICFIAQKNIRAIYKVGRQMEASSNTTRQIGAVYQSMKKKQQEKELHLCKVFGTLICFNIISWLPVMVTILIQLSGVMVSSAAFMAVQVILISRSTIHPIIETTVLKEVRMPLKSMIFCCCAAMKAKWLPDKDIEQRSGHLSSKSNRVAKKCCHYIDICGAAILFQHAQESKNDIESSEFARKKDSKPDADTV